MIVIREDDPTEVCRSLIVQLLEKHSDPDDPELLREGTGMLVVEGGAVSLNDVRIVGEEIRGAPETSMTGTPWEQVRSHYEGLLLGSGKLQEIASLLRANPLTKRALIDVWPSVPTFRDNADPCMIYVWFRVRDGRLNCHSHFRANDVYRKLLLNMLILRAAQEWLATALDIRTGDYVHFCDSFHLYRTDWPSIQHDMSRLDRPINFATPSSSSKSEAPRCE